MLIISTVFGSKMSFYTKTKNEDWGSGSDVALEMMGKRDREPEGVTTQNLTKTNVSTSEVSFLSSCYICTFMSIKLTQNRLLNVLDVILNYTFGMQHLLFRAFVLSLLHHCLHRKILQMSLCKHSNHFMVSPERMS